MLVPSLVFITIAAGVRSADVVQEKSNFFVVTAIFNPAGFASRYDLYHRFVQHMAQFEVKLVTIECIFPTLGQTAYQVTNESNPLHIQVESKSVYWVKESLINIASRRLPPHAKWICWMDADLIFPAGIDWVAGTIAKLQNYTAVQVFEASNFLGPSGEILEKHLSFGHAVTHGLKTDERPYPHPGYGWAMDLQTFREMGGLPLFDIVGSADTHFASIFIGRKLFHDSFLRLSKGFQRHIDEWRRNTVNVLQGSKSGLTLGYVSINISHEWHGSIKHRRYYERTLILLRNQFNFDTHMECDVNGLYRFKRSNTAPEFGLLAYFHQRQEDSLETEDADVPRLRMMERVCSCYRFILFVLIGYLVQLVFRKYLSIL